MLTSGTKSSWRPVTSSVPQGSILGLILFNIFVNYLDGGAECTLTKLEGLADAPEGHAAIQSNLNRLEKWSDRNIMKFYKRPQTSLNAGSGRKGPGGPGGHQVEHKSATCPCGKEC